MKLPEAILAGVNADLTANGLTPLNDEQVACLNDADRTDEALELIDDLEFRCGLSSHWRGEVAAFLVDLHRYASTQANGGAP